MTLKLHHYEASSCMYDQLACIFLCVGLKQGFLMKKMRYSDEHKKRWFLLSVVDLSYYKSYQVRLERERERGKIKDDFICSLFSKATSYVNHYL